MKSEENNKLVVRCITFNQEHYIKDALSGFILQQTDFPFTAVVIDDNSTDNEPQVLWDFVNNELDSSAIQKSETEDYIRIVAPHKSNRHCTFVILFLKYNHYSIRKNNIPYYQEWQDAAEYIALCEGDDYWTDPLKLQKQVDFLDNNPEYGLVYTNHKHYRQNSGKYIPGHSMQSDFKDMLKNNRICTLTTCMRRKLYNDYQIEFSEISKERAWKMGDYPLWLYFAANSKIKYLDDITGIYRIHENSASHFNEFKKRIDFLDSVLDVRIFFARRYGHENMIQGLLTDELNAISKAALTVDKSPQFSYLKFARKYRYFSIGSFIKILLVNHSWGRKLINTIHPRQKR